MLVKEIMTPAPACASVNDTAARVAQLMRDQDCGSIPVVDDTTGKVVGVITDRDLAIRGLAEGLNGDAIVSKLMTLYPYCARQEDDVAAVETLMAEHQVRRVPVVDDDNRCIGIVAQADLARAAQKSAVSDREVALVVERISGSPMRVSGPQPKASHSAPKVDLLADTVIVEPTSNER